MPTSRLRQVPPTRKPHIYFCQHRRRWIVRTYDRASKQTLASKWRGLRSAVIAARDQLPGQRELQLVVR